MPHVRLFVIYTFQRFFYVLFIYLCFNVTGVTIVTIELLHLISVLFELQIECAVSDTRFQETAKQENKKVEQQIRGNFNFVCLFIALLAIPFLNFPFSCLL